MIRDLIVKNRSYRRFRQDRPIQRNTLRELAELATLSASAANLQPLKYVLSCKPERNAAIYPHLAWAGYLTDWAGPAEGERPAAYIIILGDTAIARSFGCDHGIAAQSILLGSADKGIGGCMIGSIQREALAGTLGIPPQFEILLVLALGYPAETVVLEPVGDDGSIEYYRDDHDVHHVPKRPVDDVIIE